MKESTQTLLFLLVAVAAVGVASQVQPTDATYAVKDEVGKMLFDAFETEAAKSLRIVRFNEETATLRDFEVAEENGVWSLPSKGGYPADAERQMAEATTNVIDLEILSAVDGSSAADHESYGLVEPSSKLEVGSTGVGTRVTLTDDSKEPLVDVIIGKQVKDTTDQHYVRRTTQDAVFTVKIDPEKFSTSFEDWIEDDLLDLNAWDVARVFVRDYTAELVMQGFRPALVRDERGEYVLDFDDGDSKWTPNSLRDFNEETRDYEAFELKAGESLNETTLNDLKSALGDLQIVDVERKPTGLSANLQAGEDFFGDDAGGVSLMRRGFAPVGRSDGSMELFSSEGEVIVTTTEGVEYVLRFGNIQIDEGADTEADPGGEGSDAGVNRYLFVMARVNEDLIEKPELEELPAESAKEQTEAGDADTEESAAEEADDEASAVEQRNQRARDEYQAKIDKARKRVDELNARFGDWYYVIADDVYKKIAVGRDELIQTTEPAEEEADDAPAGIPGLPNLSGLGIGSGETAPPAEEQPAAEAETETAPDEAAEAATEEAAGESS